jgi:PiT family inorganic phosphate transporter
MSSELVLLLVVGAAGFYMAWNIGANDVANAMGTSVGSRALTLKSALLIAAVFELSGSVLVGSHVTETVQKGIVEPTVFAADPRLYVYGMVAALLASAVWLHAATALGLPVSTTHAIVGAVAGFGIYAGGFEALHWDKMGQIVASWFTSPILGGLMGFLLFRLVAKTILDTPNPVQRARHLAPGFVFLTVFVIVLASIYKGLKNLKLDLGLGQALLYSGLSGLLASLLSIYFIFRYLRGKEHTQISDQYAAVERIFRYLQIMSAASVAFAHGANDVANAIGPVAGVVGTLRTGSLATSAQVPFWLLLLGGVGIVVGLATYGYKVINTIGTKITELTPTRGFSAELAASITILVGSRLGLPISTTHVLVGSVVGVGFARGIAALNLRILRGIFSSWVLTVPLSALLAVVFFVVLKAIFP